MGLNVEQKSRHPKNAWVKSAPYVALFGIMGCGFSACSLGKMTGNFMSSFATEHVLPYTMTTRDLRLACASGESQANSLLAFGRVMDAPPHLAAIGALQSAGTCMELAAREAELRRLRATFEGRPTLAIDEHTVAKQTHAQAATRFYAAWKHAEAIFGEIGSRCPENAEDELAYLLALTSGLLAVSHDGDARHAAGVPREILPQAMRGSECLDNHKWWGVPAAIRVMVWLGVPGALPEGVDPWAVLADSTALGDAAGVYVARAFAAQAANAYGQPQLLCSQIHSFGEQLTSANADSRYALLNEVAAQTVWHELNKLWMESKGYRAQSNTLECYWDETNERISLEPLPSPDEEEPQF